MKIIEMTTRAPKGAEISQKPALALQSIKKNIWKFIIWINVAGMSHPAIS